ncbi:unnamed protein product [Paramecium sonneborni]|uniref:Uncharacterized protein n=1 Tax=Paramecium sonneborni TaxID=65129 RepID=A0A8S1MUR3_9CILI|nr:unnamed protein product [Paramecium sonneborni]
MTELLYKNIIIQQDCLSVKQLRQFSQLLEQDYQRYLLLNLKQTSKLYELTSDQIQGRLKFQRLMKQNLSSSALNYNNLFQETFFFTRLSIREVSMSQLLIQLIHQCNPCLSYQQLNLQIIKQHHQNLSKLIQETVLPQLYELNIVSPDMDLQIVCCIYSSEQLLQIE